MNISFERFEAEPERLVSKLILTVSASLRLSLTGVLVALAPLQAAALEPASPHPVVAELITEGIAGIGEDADADKRIKVTPPLITTQMSAKQQKEAMESIFGTGRKFDRYMKDSIVAAQKINVETDQKLGDATIRRIDLYFVAHASVKLIKDEDLMKEFMAQDKKERDEEPDDGIERYMELRHRDPEQAAAAKDNPDAKPTADVNSEQPYVNRYRLPLIDKVVISGLIEGQSYEADHQLIDSAVSARELLNDPLDPTVWQAIPRKAEGDADLSEPTPYRGFFGYLQATDLKFKRGAILVECHAFLVEPYDWFEGRSLLSTKLPAVAQNNVRSFRRKLKIAKENLASN